MNKYCLPCKECIFQVFFSHFENPDMEDADHIPYDFLDLAEYINPPDIYNFPLDLPTHNSTDIRKLSLEKVLYPIPPMQVREIRDQDK